ncbi:carbohydrate kinase family protein [Catenisphaera adipataccumulans]|jgi:sugar/nucleoside kinase (ribokinase family)|uniref:Sugar/nucleoside kinase (Ribokinase family) n=1 Tax=Catenisphaera adipataccumulans TaxID=700500 RepID=A0A7W8CV87_9FIRM|nr:sugar kinase [Catenisphaera adipataccumulans]MBB5182247.1 sugar/nucleoside kinase (ribokinase family) [Catenisphaera adipataccumulans]
MKSLDVICVGAAIVDIPLTPVSKNVFDIESYPLEQISMTIGGDAINESTIISRLGHKVGLISMAGDDAVGKYIVEHCEKEGIDHTGVVLRPGVDTSINIGLVTANGERTFITNLNGSLWKMNIDDVDLDLIPQAKILSLASFFNNPLLDNDALVKIFRKAKEAGMIIVADMIKPRLQETFDGFKEALSYVDYFFPNVDEAQLMTGETDLEKVAKKIISYGVKHAVIKIGKRGVFIYGSDGTNLIVPAVKGITALDTIGAGDNFASGFITGLLEGKSVEECGQYGNVAASIAIQSIGATAGLKNRAMFDERLAEYRRQYNITK